MDDPGFYPLESLNLLPVLVPILVLLLGFMRCAALQVPL